MGDKLGDLGIEDKGLGKGIKGYGVGKWGIKLSNLEIGDKGQGRGV